MNVPTDYRSQRHQLYRTYLRMTRIWLFPKTNRNMVQAGMLLRVQEIENSHKPRDLLHGCFNILRRGNMSVPIMVYQADLSPIQAGNETERPTIEAKKREIVPLQTFLEPILSEFDGLRHGPNRVDLNRCAITRAGWSGLVARFAMNGQLGPISRLNGGES